MWFNDVGIKKWFQLNTRLKRKRNSEESARFHYLTSFDDLAFKFSTLSNSFAAY